MVVSEFADLVGKTLTDCVRFGNERLEFQTATHIYSLEHVQDCCESVNIEDICGDLSDLVGSPIVLAEEVTSIGDEDHCEDPGVDWTKPEPVEFGESWTWTFYRIATVKGTVTIRWLGESNGYYSESVDFNVCERAAK